MFLNPLFLFGTVAAGVPLVIHLMHKRHSSVVSWPTLRFLVASNRRTARRRQVQELLLLLLRMALLALLAIALARPVLRSAGVGGGGAEVAVAVVLDNSMSTGARLGGDAGERDAAPNRFAVSKAAAEEVLRGLPSGASSALRLADGTEAPGAHALSRNASAVIAALRSARASDARGDMGARVAEAIKDVSAHGAPNGEVYVFTDMQAAAFSRAPVVPKSGSRPVSVIVVNAAAEPFRGVAVTSVAVRARRFVAASPLGFDVRLKNHSPAAVERRAVLELDGKGALAERLVKLEPGGSVGFSFQATIDAPGVHTGRVYVTPTDDLPADDVRHFRLELASRIPVYVVERTRSAVRAARSSYFIGLALNPGSVMGVPGEAAAAISPIAPTTVRPEQVSTQSAYGLLKETQVVVLADLGPMAPAEAELWVNFVKAGGTLLVFPSAAAPAGDGARALSRAAGAPFLPAEIGAVVGDPDARGEPRRIDVERVDFRRDGVMDLFRDAEETLSALSVWKAYSLTSSHAAGGRDVLPLKGGGSFLVSRSLGEGEVYLFAVPASRGWSDLPARSLFLPLVHTLVYRASAPREQERSFLTGAGVRLPLPAEAAGEPVFVTGPRGARTQHAVEISDDGVVDVALPPLSQAGVYHVTWGKTGEGEARSVTLVANPDPEESDPARVGAARMRELYADAAGAEPVVVDDPSGLDDAIARVRKGFELWDYLLSFALGVALFECFFANRVAARSKREAAAA